MINLNSRARIEARNDRPVNQPPKDLGNESIMERELLTTKAWEEAAKNFNLKDDRVQKKLAEFQKMPTDAYDERVTLLAEIRHLVKLVPAKTQNAAKYLHALIQALDKEQGRTSKAQKAAKAQGDETFTPQEAANLIRKVKFSGLKWDPKRLQQAHQAIDRAITVCHWKAHTHFGKRVLERGPKYKIHNGDDLQDAIHSGHSQPDDEGKFKHQIALGGYIMYNPSTRTIITLV